MVKLQIPHFLQHCAIRLLCQPIYELFLLNKWVPCFWIPLQILIFFFLNAGCSTKKQHSRVITLLNVNEAKDEDIGISTNVALHRHIAELALRMNTNFIMLCLYEVNDNMRGDSSSVALRVAKPFAAILSSTLNNSSDLMYSTVAAGMCRQFLPIELFIFLSLRGLDGLSVRLVSFRIAVHPLLQFLRTH